MNATIRRACWSAAILAGIVTTTTRTALAQRSADRDADESAQREENGESPDQFDDRYAGLMDNNIFLRDRHPRREEPRDTTPPPPPPPPEASWLLTGVVFEEGVFHAYFENLQTHEVLRMEAGSAIANGIIGELYIDSVSYLSDGEIFWIDIGDDLTGKAATLPSSSRFGSRSSSEERSSASRDDEETTGDDRVAESRDGDVGDKGDKGDAAKADGDNGDEQGMSVLERMRRNRERELSGN